MGAEGRGGAGGGEGRGLGRGAGGGGFLKFFWPLEQIGIYAEHHKNMPI